MTTFAADAAAHGLALGEPLGAGGYGRVFAVTSQSFGRCALKVPDVAPAPPEEHPDVVAHGHGPNRITLVSATGPFVLRAPRTIEEAAALLDAACRRQRTHGAPLPVLHRVYRLGGQLAALMERIDGPHLGELPPERARAHLPALARAVRALHAGFGPHGDLKPAHVLLQGDAVRLIDPLVGDGAVGSIGYALPMPVTHGDTGRLRDLVALAAIAAELHGARLPLDGRVVYRLANRGNGRFGRGADARALRGEVEAVTEGLPCAAWIRDVLGTALDLLHDPRLGAPDAPWCDAMLDALAGPAAVAFTLTVVSGPDGRPGDRRPWVLHPERPLTIGRNPAIADIALPDRSIGSHRPYRLELRGGDVVLRGEGAAHPPVVRGVAGPVHVLKDGDLVALGAFVLRFER